MFQVLDVLSFRQRMSVKQSLLRLPTAHPPADHELRVVRAYEQATKHTAVNDVPCGNKFTMTNFFRLKKNVGIDLVAFII
jgi:hypothetical protein